MITRNIQSLLTMDNALSCMSVIKSAIPNASCFTLPGLNGSIILYVQSNTDKQPVPIISEHKCGLYIRSKLKLFAKKFKPFNQK